jgi:hypothetical protein
MAVFSGLAQTYTGAMVRRAAAILVFVGLVWGCGESPTTPSSSKPSFVPLNVSCVTSPSFRCTAFRFGEGDVTARVSWSAADSSRLAMDAPVTRSSVVDFPTPGVPRILQPGAVYIRADYLTQDSGPIRDVAPNSYLVTPGEASVPAASISGATTGVGGATIEIIDGEGAGRRTVSREDNAYFTIEFLRLGAPFTIRASKDGYIPDVQTHPGIVNSASGFPTNTTIHFSLLRSP